MCCCPSFSPGMLDHLKVDVYGEKLPLKACGTVLVRDPQLLAISVFDPSVSQHAAANPFAVVCGLQEVSQPSALLVLLQGWPGGNTLSTWTQMRVHSHSAGAPLHAALGMELCLSVRDPCTSLTYGGHLVRLSSTFILCRRWMPSRKPSGSHHFS